MADDKKPRQRLSVKQRKFCLAYVGEANGDGGKAAKIAGYQAATDNAFRVIASQNLKKPAVKEFLDELQTEAEAAARKKIMERTEVLVGLSDIARGDLADVLGDDAPEWLTKAKEKGWSKLVKSISLDKETGALTKVELYSAHEAQRDLGKHHGLFPTRITISKDEADAAIDEAIREHGLPDDDDDDAPPATEYPM